MQKLDKIARLDGKKLKRFCEVADKVKPGTEITEKFMEWDKIKESSLRSSRIMAFMNLREFSNKEIARIKNRLNLFFIVKPVAFALVFLLCSFVIMKYIQFVQLPLVYTYGNNIPVYSTPDTISSRQTQMDIFGKKFTVDSRIPTNSQYQMLLLDSTQSYIKVRKNNFIHWLFKMGSPGYIINDGLVFSKKEYYQYNDIFNALNGDNNLVNLNTRCRKIIYDEINKNPLFQNSVLADDYPKGEIKAGYSKLLPISLGDSITYIFIRIKSPTGTRNWVMGIDDGNNVSFNELMENNKPLPQPGTFKADSPPGMTFPDILYNYDRKKDLKSSNPPYSLFNKLQ